MLETCNSIIIYFLPIGKLLLLIKSYWKFRFVFLALSSLVFTDILQHFYWWIRFVDDATKSQSGLLENDDIIVSRRANSYVFTAVAKKNNGPEAMLKKAGADGITVTSLKAADLDAEKDAEIAVIPTSK